MGLAAEDMMAIKLFNLVGYLTSKGASPTSSISNEYALAKCPACGKEKHCNVNTGDKRGVWGCFKCHASGGLLDLIMLLEKLSLPAAISFVRSGQLVAVPEDLSVTSTIKMEEYAPYVSLSSLVRVGIDLPEGFESLRGKENWYAKHRRLTSKMIDEYNIGFIRSGKYHDRLVVPDTTEDGKVIFWDARAAYSNMVPPHAFPSRADIGYGTSDLLFNLFHARQHKHIVMVEGLLDAVRIGKNAIATFGTGLKGRQIEWLLESDFDSITIMYDCDGTVTQSLVESIANRLMVFTEVHIASLPDGGDPDDYSRKALENIIASAPVYKEEDYLYQLGGVL